MRYVVKIKYKDCNAYYNNIKYRSRERAERVMKEALEDERLKKAGMRDVYIVEKPCISSPGAVDDIISICRARNAERCNSCVAGGEPCEDLKRIYWVDSPMYINRNCDEETED